MLFQGWLFPAFFFFFKEAGAVSVEPALCLFSAALLTALTALASAFTYCFRDGEDRS